MVHLKPLPLPSILGITTNNTSTTIFKRTDNHNGQETITLENGENKFTDWNYGFYFDDGMKQNQITSFDFSKYDTSMVTDMSYMFSGCTKLTSLDLSNFDTSKVTYMYGMFKYCSKLASLDLSNFDTSMATSMGWLFYDCTKLTSLDVSSFDTSKVTNMSYMFTSCYNLTHIKCKQSFKDWCITNQTIISLPTAMRDGGGGTWEIVE